MSLVLLRGKADSAHNNPCFMAPPSEFTTFEFPISNYFNFQNFVRSCRDSKEKLPGRVPTPPLWIAMASQTNCNFLCPSDALSCPPTGGRGWRGGGIFAGKGWGGLKAWDDDDVKMMTKWLAFYNFLQKEFSKHLRGAHRGLLLCDFFFCSSSFAQVLHFTFCISFFENKANQGEISAGLKTLTEIFGTSQKFRRFTKI